VKWWWRLFAVGLAAGLLTGGPVAAAPDRSQPIAVGKPIAWLVRQLDSSDYRVRQTATRQLVQAGGAAIGPVAHAALEGSLEVALRAVAILRAIYTTAKDDATVDAAESALEQLKSLPNRVVAGRADTVLAGNYPIRQRRAVAEIRKLGGIVNFSNGRVRRLRPVPSGIRPVEDIQLTPDWKGGNAGLKHIKRLTYLRALYHVAGDHVSEKALDELKAALPNLVVHLRGRSRLGIKGQNASRGQGCFVSEVTTGGTAAKGGVKPGDVITKFAGRKVPDFNILIALIKITKPGDKIPVIVLRNNRVVTLTITMQGWSNK